LRQPIWPGRWADRTYLEKLLFLYLEFEEAHFGNYQNTYDLLRQTKSFYEITREKLDGAFGGMYVNLSHHFKEVMGVEKNYYLESIEKNIAYLEKVVALNEAGISFHAQARRHRGEISSHYRIPLIRS